MHKLLTWNKEKWFINYLSSNFSFFLESMIENLSSEAGNLSIQCMKACWILRTVVNSAWEYRTVFFLISLQCPLTRRYKRSCGAIKHPTKQTREAVFEMFHFNLSFARSCSSALLDFPPALLRIFLIPLSFRLFLTFFVRKVHGLKSCNLSFIYKFSYNSCISRILYFICN